MKKILFLIFFVIHFSSIAQSIDGSMNCTVTGNVVVSSEEGKFKTYSGLEGGVKTNEVLLLAYKVLSNSIYIELKRDKAENNTVINAYLSGDNSDTTIEKSKTGGFIFNQSSFERSISFLPDYIRIKEIREFALIRYYKNDWHGIYVYVSPLDLSTHTITLNCRHTNDKMESAFKALSSFKSRK